MRCIVSAPVRVARTGQDKIFDGWFDCRRDRVSRPIHRPPALTVAPKGQDKIVLSESCSVNRDQLGLLAIGAATSAYICYHCASALISLIVIAPWRLYYFLIIALIRKLKNCGFIAQNAQNALGEGLCFETSKTARIWLKICTWKEGIYLIVCAKQHMTILLCCWEISPRKLFFRCSGSSRSNLSNLSSLSILSSFWFPDVASGTYSYFIMQVIKTCE